MALDPIDHLREAIQAVLTAAGDGWTLGHFVCVTSIEKLTDGDVDSTVWLINPSNQPEWMVKGLLDAALAIQDTCDVDDD